MRATVDGNEAAVSVAYRLSEVCCIYPITPSSPMAELADEWSSAEPAERVGQRCPAWSRCRARAAPQGRSTARCRAARSATTFTASQGLLLMIPNMYKIAGELTAAVLHVAARSLAAQGLSIFGDHSDVMAVRQTGFALLCSASVQEAHDLALVAHASTLASSVPFVHFFDGFRTSHELNTIELLDDEDLVALVPEELVREHRCAGALARAAVHTRHGAEPRRLLPGARDGQPLLRTRAGDRAGRDGPVEERTGRRYGLVEYSGDPEAERVLVLMGSGGQTARETVAYLQRQGERVGVAQVRLYRPFPARALAQALPASVRSVAVLDRTKEPGSFGEPLFLDVLAALERGARRGRRT